MCAVLIEDKALYLSRLVKNSTHTQRETSVLSQVISALCRGGWVPLIIVASVFVHFDCHSE